MDSPLIYLEVVWSTPPIPFILVLLLAPWPHCWILCFGAASVVFTAVSRCMLQGQDDIFSIINVILIMMMICSCWLQLTPSLHWGSLQVGVEWAGMTCITAVKYSAHYIGLGRACWLMWRNSKYLGVLPVSEGRMWMSDWERLCLWTSLGTLLCELEVAMKQEVWASVLSVLPLGVELNKCGKGIDGWTTAPLWKILEKNHWLKNKHIGLNSL